MHLLRAELGLPSLGAHIFRRYDTCVSEDHVYAHLQFALYYMHASHRCYAPMSRVRCDGRAAVLKLPAQITASHGVSNFENMHQFFLISRHGLAVDPMPVTSMVHVLFDQPPPATNTVMMVHSVINTKYYSKYRMIYRYTRGAMSGITNTPLNTSSQRVDPEFYTAAIVVNAGSEARSSAQALTFQCHRLSYILSAVLCVVENNRAAQNRKVWSQNKRASLRLPYLVQSSSRVLCSELACSSRIRQGAR